MRLGISRVLSLFSLSLLAASTPLIHAQQPAPLKVAIVGLEHGHVTVWIGSQGAAAGLPGAGVYCATKAFLSGLARAAHNEYAGRGVRVHLAHPGLMRTPRTAAVADRFAAAHAIAVGDVEDIAGRLVTLFLSADAACVEVNL